MRLTLQAVTLGALLAALLTWLLINGNGGMEAAYLATQRTVDALALAESRMQHDVLRARTGLLRNYDPIVAHLREMQKAGADLQASNAGDPDVQALAEAVEREAAMVERFKTGNALVQNSIAYFDSLSDRLSESDIAPGLARAVAALQIRISELVRDSTPARLADIRTRLETLHAADGAAARAGDVDAIVLHGRQLLELLPHVDAVTRSLPASSSEAAREALLESRRSLRDRRQARADGFRLALYAVALALLALVVRVGVLMRAGTRILRRTVDFQTVVAQAANRFLAIQPDETDTRIVDVLAMVGEGLDTDHGYVLMLDGTGAVHLWNRPGLAPPSGWPAAQQALVHDVAAAASDLIFVEVADETGPPALRRSLAERGVVSWACARLRRGDRIVGLLCFERTTSGLPPWLRHSRGLLQVVADSFAAALERQHVWAERREIEAALRRAQRLEAIGTFASGVAHNINNVLNVMLGHAEIAGDALPAHPGRAAEHIGLLVQAGGRAREIAGQILDFGRPARSAQCTSAADAVVHETVAQIRASTAGPATIALSGTAAGARVGGEPAQLQQVVHNLIRNAVQASAPGAAVDVRLDHVALPRSSALTHGTLRPGAYVRIRVSDTGRGMDEATLARIFEPFFTTRPAGTGLGLATAFEFVQEHDGAFDVRSAPGSGSTFAVWLPVIPQAAAGAAAGGTVMLVGRTRRSVQDDEETLAALGYEPVGYADPEAALAVLRREPGRFDLLIVDNRLVDLSGLAFAHRAARISGRPIVLSLSSTDAVQPELLAAVPVADIVRRPWRSNALALTLRRHLASADPARRPAAVS
ncbi:Signal transduction histidine kinase [Methylobacterium sp. UNC300MFChir4.1]|uniref:two-component system VirA-like sensor kinase n=1 Tax=Methylobacterium sp. UNC300MFChir4.1 TaxID=1502747 RepID=UPI0008C16F28|nr:two-component system VirA-like sensor kinase [Methylobacterium sp. UNC300MFChir4.1]SEO50602.1 Signal transduction histidine kinase [Methylobacterium sp. UNC300MFChir4.1]